MSVRFDDLPEDVLTEIGGHLAPTRQDLYDYRQVSKRTRDAVPLDRRMMSKLHQDRENLIVRTGPPENQEHTLDSDGLIHSYNDQWAVRTTRTGEHLSQDDLSEMLWSPPPNGLGPEDQTLYGWMQHGIFKRSGMNKPTARIERFMQGGGPLFSTVDSFHMQSVRRVQVETPVMGNIRVICGNLQQDYRDEQARGEEAQFSFPAHEDWVLSVESSSDEYITVQVRYQGQATFAWRSHVNEST